VRATRPAAPAGAVGLPGSTGYFALEVGAEQVAIQAIAGGRARAPATQRSHPIVAGQTSPHVAETLTPRGSRRVLQHVEPRSGSASQEAGVPVSVLLISMPRDMRECEIV
jgi:hypothetical protein